MTMSVPTRPVLRYHGGKWRLAPWIISHFPKHRVYTEAYGGAASVLLRKPRSHAEVYNDLDGEIVNVFRVLRDPESAARLKTLLELTPYSRAEFAQAFEPTDDLLEQVRRTMIRSRMGFGSSGVFKRNTGFRANSNRSHTTPAHDWQNFPDVVPAFTERLRGVAVERREALDIIRRHDSETTLHYVDPPYHHDTRKFHRGQSGQYRHEMTGAQHAELLTVLKTLKGMVVLSGYPTDMYDRELNGWMRAEKRALADGARERMEVLWLNPVCAAALAAQRKLQFA